MVVRSSALGFRPTVGRIGNWYEQRVFNPLMDRALRSAPVAQLRSELLRSARGEVVEIGVGTGLNLPHYPHDVRRVRAVVREAEFDTRALRRSADCGRELELVRGDAHQLPLDDASVDTLVCTFVLCSVADPSRAAAEFARVLRPGGRLLIAEHVLSPRRSERLVQRALSPLHRCWACGCRLDRDLRSALGEGGLDVREVRSSRSSTLPFPASELIVGSASRPR